MIVNFTPRLYQQTILATTAKQNSLVVLPTGLGKTAIAFLLTALRLSLYPKSKILMVAPTKPLCEQHKKSFQTHLSIDPEKIVMFTGSIKPAKREEMWKDAQVIISTPQGLENDLINRKISFEDTTLLIFDEAHHATGDYSYVWIAKHYMQKSENPRILALTASPGANLEKIEEVCKNLHIEKIEVRTEKDHDVKPYIQKTELEWIGVDFPEQYKIIHKTLLELLKKRKLTLGTLGVKNVEKLNKTQLLKIQGILRSRLSKEGMSFEVMKGLSIVAECVKIEHALELLECQGIIPLHSYLSRLQEESTKTKVKAVKNIVMDPLFQTALVLTKSVMQRNIEYPKKTKMVEIVKDQIINNSKSKIIIFTNLRDTAKEVSETLDTHGFTNTIFVGQMKKNGLGLTQKKQKEVLDKFRVGEFQILIATSVAEEGLDIPAVNKVIFYEPTPSAIRSIQRRGRTGRLEDGSVTILYTKKTRDEAYRWASIHKERKMYQVLESIKNKFKTKKIGFNATFDTAQKTLENFKKEKKKLEENILKRNIDQEKILILADHREKDNKVVKELINNNIPVKVTQLTSADYVVSGAVGVELKKVPDFVGSILDGRLFEQVRELKKTFQKSLLIIEGEQDIFAARNINANAIRGALATIVLNFGVPVLYTKDAIDTAQLLIVMAKREQNKGTQSFSLHQQKPTSIKFQQEYIVSAFPLIGPRMAKELLLQCGSIETIVNASEKELRTVPGVGEKIAKALVAVFKENYVKKINCD